jgi:hypothetical protein
VGVQNSAGKDKGKHPPLQSSNGTPSPPMPSAAAPSGQPPTASNPPTDSEVLASLKSKLEGIRLQIAALQAVEGSETATKALQDLASTLAARISSLEPTPSTCTSSCSIREVAKKDEKDGNAG